MFERFTESGIKTIMLAQEEARRLGHNFVGSEQILLGLIGEGAGIAARTLRSAGVNLKDARVEVEKIIGRGSGFVAAEIPFTPRAKRVLELSWEEARHLGHNYIGTEHLLLGLIREAGGVGSRVLEILHVDIIGLRKQIIRACGGTVQDPLPSEPMVPADTANLKANLADGAFFWYSEDAILTIQRAWDYAETVGVKEIGSEPLVLVILRDDTLFIALNSAELNLGDIRRELLKGLEPGDTRPAKALPFSAQAQKSLEYAWSEAVRLRERCVTKECIFLGLLGQEESVFAQVLKTLGADANALRNSVEFAVKVRQEKAAALGVAAARRETTKSTAAGAIQPDSFGLPIVLHWLKKIALIITVIAVAAFALGAVGVLMGVFDQDRSFSVLQSLLWICLIANAIYFLTPSPGGTMAYRLKLFPLHNPNLRWLTGILVFWPLILIYGVLLYSAPIVYFPAILLGTLLTMLLVPICWIFFPSFPVLTDSMKPAVIQGDGVVVQRLTRVMSRPLKRGEVIVFRAKPEIIQFIPASLRESLADFSVLAHKLGMIDLCKRVVGLPGDTIEISEGSLHINGQPLKEPWATGFEYALKSMSDIGYLHHHPFPDQQEPIVVPPNCYFVLGDNRSCVNIDSSVFGCVSSQSIWARCAFVFWRDGKFKFVAISYGGLTT